MSYPLDFQIQHRYRTLESGIEIPAALRSGTRTALCQAKVDTGSALWLFQRELAEMPGLEVESGYRRELSTLTFGGLIAYGHSVTLHTLGVEVESLVYFAADYHMSRNLLGREGWLQKVRVAVVDYDAEIYLSAYDAG